MPVFFKKLETYNSIEDLPIGNFQRIMKEGDLKYMIIKGTFKKKHLPKLEKAWINCYNQYLQTFGLFFITSKTSKGKRAG